MAKFQPITDAEIAAMDAVIDAERCGAAIEQLAEGDARIVKLAKALQFVLGELRQDFYDYAAERDLPRDQVDAVFDAILTSMLGSRGRVQ